jgi:hydrogenase assembly chaperone HypC/HupF
MCLARPARLIEVDSDGAAGLVDDAGTPRRVTLAVVASSGKPRTGDWLLMNAGIPTQVIEPTEAAELLELLAAAERGER